jgi:hypothetical protein
MSEGIAARLLVGENLKISRELWECKYVSIMQGCSCRYALSTAIHHTQISRKCSRALPLPDTRGAFLHWVSFCVFILPRIPSKATHGLGHYLIRSETA